MIVHCSKTKSSHTGNSIQPSFKANLRLAIQQIADVAKKPCELVFLEKAFHLVGTIERPEALKSLMDKLAVRSSSLWSPSFKEVAMQKFNKILW